MDGKWHSEQTSRLDTYGVELTGGYAAAEGFLRRATLSYGYITTDRNTEVVARSAMDFMKHKAALAVEVRFLRRMSLALTASVYLATVGPDGLKQAASLCYQKAHYLAQQLCSIPGVSLRYSGTFFHEFVTDQKDSDKLLSALEQQGILGGYPLADGGILWCATEKNTKEEMDRVVEIIRKELM